MNKMTKHGIVGLLLILAIGFASITTTFIINGTTSIGTNDLDFDVYFSKVSTDIGGVAVIDTTTRKQITYSSKSLKSIGDTATLNYTVYNNSSQYDANVSVSFNAVNVVDSIDYTDYYSITRSGFDTNDYTLVSSKDSVDGTISINLLKPVLEDVEITFTLTLDGTATERASEGTPSSLDPTIYNNTKSA